MNKKLLAVSALSLSISPLLMGAFGFEIGGTHQILKRDSTKMTTAIVADINKTKLTYNKQIIEETALLNNALKTAISQESMTPGQIAKADKNIRQIETANKNARAIADEVIEARLDYGAKTGQGYRVCKVQGENNQLNSALVQAAAEASDKVMQLDNAPGSMAPSADFVRSKREAIHKDNFCTQEEVDRGMCDKVSDLQGADSNAEVLFTSSKAGTKVDAAKSAFRQNILGNPDLQIPSNMGGTATGQAYLYNVNRKTSLSAFPAYSLAYLQSMSEVRDNLKNEKGEAQSPNDMLFNTVARYYGSPEAREWNKSMIEQRPRGLLVELAKIEGLGAWMDYQEYLTNQRIEGNLAAMTLTTALPMEEAMDRIYRKIEKTNVAGAIRQANK